MKSFLVSTIVCLGDLIGVAILDRTSDRTTPARTAAQGIKGSFVTTPFASCPGNTPLGLLVIVPFYLLFLTSFIIIS